tara:strand:- start:89 stop:775 length:687 start_codon:yes stop_codon:yes gene_type:complete
VKASQVFRRSAPPDLRIAADYSQPRAGHIEEHAIEHRTERQRVSRIESQHTRPSNRHSGQSAPKQLDTAPSTFTSDNPASPLETARERERLSAGGSAGVENPFPWRNPGEGCNQLTGFILHMKESGLERSSPKWIASHHSQAIVREAGGGGGHPLLQQRLGYRGPAVPSRIGAQRQHRRLIIEGNPLSCGVMAESLQPSAHQPIGVRTGDAEESNLVFSGSRRARINW